MTNASTGDTALISIQDDGSFSGTIVAASGNEFNVVVRDAAGNESSTQNIGTPPNALQIQILSPKPGAHVVQNRVTVRGTVIGPVNTGVTVNGIVATKDPEGGFVANDVALTPGANTLIAVARDTEDHIFSIEIPVTSDGENPLLTLSVSDAVGIAPFRARFEYQDNRDETIAGLTVDFDGDGTTDFEGRGDDLLEYVYSEPGTYTATIRVTDSTGGIEEASTFITVLDPVSLKNLHQSIWNGMNAALTTGDIETALQYLTGSARKRYQRVFEQLLPHISQIISSYSPLQQLSISSSIGEYGVNRQINGETKVFLIYFLLDTDGVFRLESM